MARPKKRKMTEEAANGLLSSYKVTAMEVRGVFQAVAEAIGGDVMQCCRDNGEEERVDRDGCYDYLEMYGGPKGLDVQELIMSAPDTDTVEALLDACKVPKYWT